MKVILRQDINKLGNRGVVKNVSPGYARNFLIPKGLAELATPEKIKASKNRQEKENENKVKEFSDSKKMIETIKNREFVLKAKTNKEGHLFAGIHENDIINEIERKTGYKLKKEEIIVSEPIKKVGKSEISLKIKGKELKILVKIEAL